MGPQIRKIKIIMVTILSTSLFWLWKFLSTSQKDFVDLDKLIFKYIWKEKRIKIVKKYWQRKIKSDDSIPPNIKVYSIIIVTKRLWYSIEQWNRIESLEILSHKYSRLIFDKGAEAIQWRKDNLFNKWDWKKWISNTKIKKLWISYLM